MTLVSYNYRYLFPIANPSLAPTHSSTFLRVTSLPCKTTCLTPGFLSAHQLTLVPAKRFTSWTSGTPNLRFLTAFGHISSLPPPIYTQPAAFSASFGTKPCLAYLSITAYPRNPYLCGLYTCICCQTDFKTLATANVTRIFTLRTAISSLAT